MRLPTIGNLFGVNRLAVCNIQNGAREFIVDNTERDFIISSFFEDFTLGET